MNYFLIIIILGQQEGAVASVPFATREACVAARAEALKPQGPYGRQRITAFCAARGMAPAVKQEAP